MEPPPLITQADVELLSSARGIIAVRHRPRWHEIGAALRTTKGRVYAAVHLEANVGRVAVCAEAIALGMAVAAGEDVIDTIAAVDANGDVVAPCGMCREMISDYAPNARVLLTFGDEINVVTISTLLPHRSRSDYL